MTPGMPPATTFGESAARLAGMAALLLGWRPEDYWRATPAELLSVLSLWAGGASGAGSGMPGMDAATLARLKEEFPDE